MVCQIIGALACAASEVASLGGESGLQKAARSSLENVAHAFRVGDSYKPAELIVILSAFQSAGIGDSTCLHIMTQCCECAVAMLQRGIAQFGLQGLRELAAWHDWCYRRAKDDHRWQCCCLPADLLKACRAEIARIDSGTAAQAAKKRVMERFDVGAKTPLERKRSR